MASKYIYKNPNQVTFGGEIVSIREAPDTAKHANGTKLIAQIRNQYPGNPKFDTVIGVTAYGYCANILKDLHKHKCCALIVGRLASDKGDSLFVIPTEVYDLGEEL